MYFYTLKLAAKFTDTRQNNIPHIMTESPNGCALFPPTSKKNNNVAITTGLTTAPKKLLPLVELPPTTPLIQLAISQQKTCQVSCTLLHVSKRSVTSAIHYNALIMRAKYIVRTIIMIIIVMSGRRPKANEHSVVAFGELTNFGTIF